MVVSCRISSLPLSPTGSVFFFFNDTATTEIYTLSLHDALPICELSQPGVAGRCAGARGHAAAADAAGRSEEHTSELQSRSDLVCRLLLEKKKKEADSRGAVRSVWAHVCAHEPAACLYEIASAAT